MSRPKTNCAPSVARAMTPLPEWIRAANERFARFSGSQFSPHELPGGPPYEDKAAVRAATKVCRDCRKREVKPRQWYCPDCARKHKRDSNRRHIRRKRGLDVGKLANSPIGAEAVTKAETEVVSFILTLKRRFWGLVFRQDKAVQRTLCHERSKKRRAFTRNARAGRTGKASTASVVCKSSIS